MKIHTLAFRDDKTNRIHVWDVYKLWKFVKEFPECNEPIIPLVQAINENLNEYGFDDWSRVVQADLSYPVIIYGNFCIMDGCHRIAKAMLLGQTEIRAVRIKNLPPPDQTYAEWIDY